MITLRNGYYDALSILGIITRIRPWCGPRVAQLNITDECNLDCIMCNRSCMGVQGFLAYEKAISVISELYALGLREIYFHGYGEPFLHPRITDMFHHVHNNYPRLAQFVVTNGSCISERMVQDIRDNQVNIRFSIHAGDEKTWGEIHPHDDVSLFQRIRTAIRAIARGRSDEVEILYVLLNSNWDRIESMIEFAHETGVKRIAFRPMRLYRNEKGDLMNDHLMLSHGQYRFVRERLLHWKKISEGNLLINMAPFLESAYDDALGRPSSFAYYQKNSCYIGWLLTVILTNGDVLGCLEESSREPVMGNVHQTSFRDIWWSPAFKKFRNDQLFKDKSSLDRTGCHSWCQHLDTNRRVNDLLNLRCGAFSRDFFPAAVRDRTCAP